MELTILLIKFVMILAFCLFFFVLGVMIMQIKVTNFTSNQLSKLELQKINEENVDYFLGRADILLELSRENFLLIKENK